MAMLGAIAGLIGTGLQVMGTMQQGKAQQAALNFQAEQDKKKASEERAASQRTAIDKRREGELVMSKQVALASASGAGFGPSLEDIYTDAAGRTAYNADVEMYGGESRARGLLDSAEAAKMKGKAAAKGAMFEALGAGFGGISKLFG